jgi:hypothetical protein
MRLPWLFRQGKRIWITPQQIQRDMAQPTEGLRPFVFANPAGILSKGHLHAPMLSHRVTEPHPIGGQ